MPVPLCRRSPKDDLIEAKNELAALAKVGISGSNAQRVRSADQVIADLLEMM